MTIIDITYQTNIGERHGRRRMYDNHTGEMWWESPKVDLTAAHNADVEEKRLLKEALGPLNPAPKSRAKKRLIHG
jgi:hypothetical protein